MASKTLYFSTWEGKNSLPLSTPRFPPAGLAFLKHKVDLHARGAQRQGLGEAGTISDPPVTYSMPDACLAHSYGHAAGRGLGAPLCELPISGE